VRWTPLHATKEATQPFLVPWSSLWASFSWQKRWGERSHPVCSTLSLYPYIVPLHCTLTLYPFIIPLHSTVVLGFKKVCVFVWGHCNASLLVIKSIAFDSPSCAPYAHPGIFLISVRQLGFTRDITFDFEPCLHTICCFYFYLSNLILLCFTGPSQVSYVLGCEPTLSPAHWILLAHCTLPHQFLLIAPLLINPCSLIFAHCTLAH